MSVGFIVNCDKCGNTIVKTKGLEQNSFDELNSELGKVTEGLIGIGPGKLEISGYEDMVKLAGFAMYCSKSCASDNWISSLRKFINDFKR